MSFKLFIYYCALGGGWAAFLAWGIVQLTGILHVQSLPLRAALVGGCLGLCVATAIGLVDALLNAVGLQRVLRIGVCLPLGFVGGLVGGFIGEVFYEKLGVPLFFGWMLAGTCIGASIGVFDLLRALVTGNSIRVPVKKTLNGVYGGLLGGLIGGAPFGYLLMDETIREKIPRANLAIGLVLLGICVGLLIGLAQVILKEAWLKIERGFRAGREVLLAKDETVIGRAEGCDVGIFGDMDIEKKHARIVLEGDRYVVHDNNSARGTYVNDRRVTKPQELVTGDLIRVGNCYLRFGERQKRA